MTPTPEPPGRLADESPLAQLREAFGRGGPKPPAAEPSPMWVALTQGTVAARSRTYAEHRTEPVTAEQATMVLQAELARTVTAGGRVEPVGTYSAVVVHGSRPNHILHLLLSILTAGLWLIVWAVVAVTNRTERTLVSVDGCGNLTRQRA